MPVRRLYGHALSGNTHKVRLLLSILGLAYEEVGVDIPAGAHKAPAYLAVNPLGQVPLLADEDGTAVRDSQAILIYLAARYGGTAWWPADPRGQGWVAQWLSFAANEMQHGPNLARLHHLLGVPVDLPVVQARAREALGQLDRHLDGRAWLELDGPTIADLACFPYAALAPEGGVPLDPYPHVRAWSGRVRALPGFVPMPGL